MGLENDINCASWSSDLRAELAAWDNCLAGGGGGEKIELGVTLGVGHSSLARAAVPPCPSEQPVTLPSNVRETASTKG